MGNKATARALMRDAGVPMLPGTEGVVQTLGDARTAARKIGYPVMVKAAAGGGGRGMRIAREDAELTRLLPLAQAEAMAAFGNGDVYLERYLDRPRHVEVQVLADNHGHCYAIGERDCSLQRRHQKLVEEAPAPNLNKKVREQLLRAAVKGAKAAGYTSAGTLEFLLDQDGRFYFMEMNTRIQVEHPITEEVINYDLVKEQIKLAAGEHISGKNYFPQMHAIECRINAEDPYNNFRPAPGRITTLHVPGGHGVRVDSHIYAGYSIPPNYDSMIAKLITIAQTREEAINTMERALSEFVVEGVKTTVPFHQQLMKHPDFRKGNYTTKFMENFKMEPE
jgi:acetyl-CoA carboxylase biotin carboxylase subunit